MTVKLDFYYIFLEKLFSNNPFEEIKGGPSLNVLPNFSKTYEAGAARVEKF